MKKKETKPAGKLAVGRYRARETFVPSKIDKRLRDGLFSTEGLPKGAMVWVLAARHDDGLLEMCFPWKTGTSPVAQGLPDGTLWWGIADAMGADDWTRFLANLEPDAGDESWLDEKCGASMHMREPFSEVLLELLAVGALTRAQIQLAVLRVDARANEQPIPAWAPGAIARSNDEDGS